MYLTNARPLLFFFVTQFISILHRAWWYFSCVKLQSLGISSSKAKNAAGKATAEELAQVYDTMLGHGFKKEHVQQALQVEF